MKGNNFQEQIASKTYIADNWLTEDKESGILPVNSLAERKLQQVKIIMCFPR